MVNVGRPRPGVLATGLALPLQHNSPPALEHSCLSSSRSSVLPLNQGLAAFFSKRPEGKYFRLCGPDGFCLSDSTQLLEHEGVMSDKYKHGWVPI